MLAATIFALLALSGFDLSATAVDSVPAQFIGIWSPDLRDCTSGDNDGIVRIRPDYISHWESEGPIRAVVVRGRHELALISELEGEGETRLETQRYVLAATEDRMFARNIPGRELTLYRCPENGSRSTTSSKPTPLRGAA